MKHCRLGTGSLQPTLQNHDLPTRPALSRGTHECSLSQTGAQASQAWRLVESQTLWLRLRPAQLELESWCGCRCCEPVRGSRGTPTLMANEAIIVRTVFV